MTTTFESAEIGDKVWSIEYGWGEIDGIRHLDTNPIKVRFRGDAYTSFNLDGSRYNEYPHQTLFWDEVKITAPQKPHPDLEVDTKVIIWSDTAPKARRYFSHFNSSGKIECFVNGMTSWTTKQTMDWPYWELAE